MNRYKIAQVDFPFLDENKIKSRPCLVLTKPKGKFQIVVIAYMTSSQSEIEDTDIVLDIDEKNFEETGLMRSTIIKLHRLEHISVSDLKGQVGELDLKKSKEIQHKLGDLFEI